MDSSTRRALAAINRRFYTERARDFSESREHPWPGWERLLEAIPTPRGEFKVLDVGCGNGRFARFLAERWTGLFDYLGIDASDALLALARERYRAVERVHFTRCDFLDAPPDACLPEGPFDLIGVFGVLHHVPSFELRRELLAALARRLTRVGWLALSVWRFEVFERFARRFLPWEEYLRRAPHALDLSQLDKGDHLLRFAEDGGCPRYCHFADDAEVAGWLRGLPVQSRLVFDADGRGDRTNRYTLLQRRTAGLPEDLADGSQPGDGTKWPGPARGTDSRK